VHTATASRRENPIVYINTFWTCGGLLAAFVIFLLFMRIRRRMSAHRPAQRRSPVFDLAELRAMLDTGQITPEEHERLRAALTRQLDPGDASTPSTSRGFEVRPPKRPADETSPAGD
jgi:hypothetical protein